MKLKTEYNTNRKEYQGVSWWRCGYRASLQHRSKRVRTQLNKYIDIKTNTFDKDTKPPYIL